MPFPSRPAENADPWYATRETYDQAIEDAITAEHDSDGVHDLDSIADGSTKVLMTATERTKLSGIEALADVTDATNVDAAGAVMNSDTSTASMSFVIDEDSFATDSATKVPTQQSVKAYVDANAGGGGFAEDGWQSGAWQYPGLTGPMVGTSTSTTGIGTTMWLSAIDIVTDVQVDALAINVTIAAGSSVVRLGVFTFDGTTATTLIDGGTVNTTATGAKLATFTATDLPTGRYFLGLVASVGGVTLTSTSSAAGWEIAEASLFSSGNSSTVTNRQLAGQSADATGGWDATYTGWGNGATGNVPRIGIRRA